MMMRISGKVVRLLENGFVLWNETDGEVIISTQVEGAKLGLKPGDKVEVWGGWSGDKKCFLSSRVFKKRLFRSSVEIPCNLTDLEFMKADRG